MKCHVDTQGSTEVCHILTKKITLPLCLFFLFLSPFSFFFILFLTAWFFIFSPAPFPPPPLAILFCTIYTPANGLAWYRINSIKSILFDIKFQLTSIRYWDRSNEFDTYSICVCLFFSIDLYLNSKSAVLDIFIRPLNWFLFLKGNFTIFISVRVSISLFLWGERWKKVFL